MHRPGSKSHSAQRSDGSDRGTGRSKARCRPTLKAGTLCDSSHESFILDSLERARRLSIRAMEIDEPRPFPLGVIAEAGDSKLPAGMGATGEKDPGGQVVQIRL